MKKYSYHVGIDVSKKKLDATVLRCKDMNMLKHMVVGNSEEGILTLLRFLRDSAIPAKAVLFASEFTGVYTYCLSAALLQHKLDYWAINSLDIKRSAGIVRTKNDRSDSKGIAEYSIRNLDKLRLLPHSCKEVLQLRLLFSERSKLIKSLSAFDITKENKGFMSGEIFISVEELNAEVILALRAMIKKVDAKMLDIVKQNELLSRLVGLITTVPGIGTLTALYFVITTNAFENFDSWRKYACYAGVAPFEYASGTSVKRPSRVHHFGNKKMKSLLNMCAMASIRHDSQIRQYYKKKKGEGKHSRVIFNNVKCKLISRVFAVVRRGTPYADVFGYA